MKHFSTLSLMLLLALTWVVPKAEAQYSYSLATSYDWYTAYTTTNTDARQAAIGPYGSVYALSNTAEYETGVKGIYLISNGSGKLINSGMGSAGWANAFDDSGNYVYHANYGTNRGGTQKYNSTATCFRVKVPRSTDGTLAGGLYIDATSINFGRMSFYIDATGNCSASGTGYIWTAPSSTDANILALKVVNGAVTQKLAFDVSSFVDVSGIGVDDVVQFYETSDATSYKCMMQLRGRGIYDVTLNLNTQKVVSCNQISDSNGNSMSLAANIFTLGGRKFVVRNTRRVGSSPSAQNLCTEFEVLDITDSYTSPVSYGARDPFPNASAGAATGAYLQSDVSGNVAKIYAYVMGGGVACYSFTATALAAPATITSVTLVEDENPNYIGRQNAEIVWTPNASWTSQPASYKVEYQYTYNNGTADVTSAWYTAGTTTTLPTAENPFVHYNVCYFKYGKSNYERTYKYRVTPMFDSAIGEASAVSAGITPKFIPIAPRWIHIFGEEAYPGVCMAQMYWSYPSYGLKPDSYDILRDGTTISGDQHVAAFVHVDYDGKPNHTHQYEIATYYNGLDNSTPAKSSVETVTFGARDWSIPKYSITEVYNFPIQEDAYEFTSNVPGPYAQLTKGNVYSQGYFRNGKWYIAQRHDGKDADVIDNEGKYITQHISSGTTGGIIVFDGDDQSQEYGKMKGGKALSLNTPIRFNQNRGVAVDDAGNIFVRGVGSSVANTSYRYWHEYEYAMTAGVIYKPESNGTYTAYTINFSAAGINFNDQPQAVTTDQTMSGRCDYYGMSGDVFSSEGGYLYVAPSQGRAVYVIKLTAGSGTTLNASLQGVYHENGTNQNTQNGALTPYKSANENYAFPVNCEGREGHQFIYNLRSNVYRNLVIDNTVGKQVHEGTLNDRNGNVVAGSPYTWNVRGVEGYAPAQPDVNVEGRIYDFHSRVNNPGGATFEFNGELFIVTPISQYSINTGSFYVGRGFRPTLSVDPVTGQANRAPAKDADLCNIVPVATVYQEGEVDASNTNASGMWCYGEVPDIAEEAARGLNADEDGDGKADYAYIYIYAPGHRFAKYRLDPDALFPPSPNEVEIVPEYEREYVDGEHNAGGDLLKYDAVVTWEPMENSYNVDGVGNYSVESYTITLCYEDGTPVLDENGDPLTVTIPVYNSATGESSEYVVLDENGNVITYTYTFPDVDLYDENGNVITYTSQVVVNYRGEDNTVAAGKTQVSVETEDQAYNDYEAVAPEGKVNIGVAEDWADWDGDKEKTNDDGYWNRFTIELEPTNPTWTDDQRPEPVSHYTIWVSSEDSETNDADKGNKQICDFYLYDPDSDPATEGVQNVTGLTPDEKGYVHITDCLIPGDYVFTPDDGIPDIYWIEVDYTGGTNGTAAELEDGKINPEEWTYTITADYAAGNEKISKSASNNMEEGGVPTGVEVINVQSSLSVYPVPATTSVTVKSSDAINTVAIYSAAGVEVKAVECAGENVVVVSVDDLAAGNYYVKVNNLKPVKIVKK